VAIGFSAITLPLILPPIGILGVFGTRKAKLTDVTVFKLDPKGALSIENSIAANHTSFYKASVPFALYDTRSFYDVSNSDSKNNYLLIDDDKEIIIYNVTQKKVARTILHKEGKLQISVFPAKEGHVTVAEYNKKEKTIRYSIEAL
jgi:hypothetical protein